MGTKSPEKSFWNTLFLCISKLANADDPGIFYSVDFNICFHYVLLKAIFYNSFFFFFEPPHSLKKEQNTEVLVFSYFSKEPPTSF